jgi:uncharacterized protein YeaO (DUF488 family)
MIRTDCYLAVLKKFKEKYPNAHFEVITRVAKSPLSPSWDLLNKAKEEKWDFDKYRQALIIELGESGAAAKKLWELKLIARKKDVFLVCYEKDASKCHRSIIKELMGNV